MLKTSVYIDEQLKADLERTVSLTGRSQAELIRDGIALVVQRARRPEPRIQETFHNGHIVGRIDELMEGFGR